MNSSIVGLNTGIPRAANGSCSGVKIRLELELKSEGPVVVEDDGDVLPSSEKKWSGWTIGNRNGDGAREEDDAEEDDPDLDPEDEGEGKDIVNTNV